MKMLFTLTLLMSCALSHAAPLTGFSTLEPYNEYKILNAKKEVIFKATADTVKDVALRDGFAVVQTSSANVSLIREDGSVVVDAVYGEEFKISKKLLAIYNPDGNGAVYTLDGTRVYPKASAASRPVTYILVANNRFAVMDAYTETLTIYDAAGREIKSFLDISRALISDGYLVLVTSLASMTLYGDDLNSSITSNSDVSQLQISDEFAGYVDTYKTLHLYSRAAGEFPMVNDVMSYSLTNTFAVVHDSSGLTVYGKDKRNLESPASLQNFAVSHQLFAYIGNTGTLWIRNEETRDSFSVNRADFYAMSDDLLVVKNGNGQFEVYSLASASFGNQVYSALDQTIAEYQVGNGIVSFQTTLATSASNSANVFVFGAQLQKSTLIDEDRVNKVDLSVNREEWNWQ